MNATDTIAASRIALPGGLEGFRVKTTLHSGNTAVYEVPRRFVRSARPDYINADCDRSRADVLMYGTHIATLMLHADGYQWFHPRTRESMPRDRYEDVPELIDLCIALWA